MGKVDPDPRIHLSVIVDQDFVLLFTLHSFDCFGATRIQIDALVSGSGAEIEVDPDPAKCSGSGS